LDVSTEKIFPTQNHLKGDIPAYGLNLVVRYGRRDTTSGFSTSTHQELKIAQRGLKRRA
jgi:hypothetical protein